MTDFPPETSRSAPAEPPLRREPVFNLPTGILVAVGLLVAVHVVQSLLPADLAEALVVDFGFSPVRYVVPFAQQSFEWLWSPVTYSLLHGGIEHLVFNCLWLAAFGTPVLRRIGSFRFAIFWIASAMAGAALHAAVNWGEPTLMVGASAVVSALMGAACRFAFGGANDIRRTRSAAFAPRLSVAQALKNRTVLVFTGAWLLGNLLFAFGLPLLGDMSASVAWDAHIGGFLFGFLLFAAFDPQR